MLDQNLVNQTIGRLISQILALGYNLEIANVPTGKRVTLIGQSGQRLAPVDTSDLLTSLQIAKAHIG